jgi:hypothetical protein
MSGKLKVNLDWGKSGVTYLLQNEDISFRNLLSLVEFSLALPGTNAEVEMTFSVINALWTDEKNKFKVQTIKAVIVVKTHFPEVSCTDFYNLLQQNTTLLTNIQSSAKYQPGAPDTSKVPQDPQP